MACRRSSALLVLRPMRRSRCGAASGRVPEVVRNKIAYGKPVTNHRIQGIEVEQLAPLDFLGKAARSQQSRLAAIMCVFVSGPHAVDRSGPKVNARRAKQIAE